MRLYYSHTATKSIHSDRVCATTAKFPPIVAGKLYLSLVLIAGKLNCRCSAKCYRLSQCCFSLKHISHFSCCRRTHLTVFHPKRYLSIGLTKNAMRARNLRVFSYVGNSTKKHIFFILTVCQRLGWGDTGFTGSKQNE